MGEKTTKATRGAALALLLTLTGCASLRAKKADAPIVKARCNEQATWLTTEANGDKIGIFICFGERNQLLYVARVLPPPQLPHGHSVEGGPETRVQLPQPADPKDIEVLNKMRDNLRALEKKIDAQRPRDPKTGRFVPKAKPAPTSPQWASPLSLPTLGGTAKDAAK